MRQIQEHTRLFSFGAARTVLSVRESLPALDELAPEGPALLVCDTNTAAIARRMAAGGGRAAFCVFPPGEEAKTWESLERILSAALEAGLGRDGTFIGVGGGVVCDLAAFAASVYMRGARLCLVPASLLCMVDAALGGKCGIDFSGIKNLAGTFYPAEKVVVPLEALDTLPAAEWKSGMAELIKTAILDGSGVLLDTLRKNGPAGEAAPAAFPAGVLAGLIAGAMEIKGRIVEEDPQEKGTRRALLNLGHSFGHALEAALGLGRISHGEAVAWGIARAVELGREKGITPESRAGEIAETLAAWHCETRAPYPAPADPYVFFAALEGDKKKKGGVNIFVVPSERGAELLPLDLKGSLEKKLIEHLVFDR